MLAQTCLSASLDAAWSEGLDRENKVFTSGLISCNKAEKISDIMEYTESREEDVLLSATLFILNNFNKAIAPLVAKEIMNKVEYE